MTEFVEIVTTTGSAGSARRIATGLVENRLVACAQTGGPIASVYRWQGAVEHAEEWTCTLKTSASLQDRVVAEIVRVHEYDEPQIVALPIVGGSEGYLRWLGRQLEA